MQGQYYRHHEMGSWQSNQHNHNHSTQMYDFGAHHSYNGGGHISGGGGDGGGGDGGGG